jgi:polysaccharide biosynthesis/export protein
MRTTLILLLLLAAAPAWAQLDLSKGGLPLLGGSEGKSGTSTALTGNTTPFPVTRTVDPALYVVGAGDLLALSLTEPWTINELVPISAEGAVLVPRVGAVRVGGMTLEKARTAVFDAIRAKYRGADGTLTLVQPRSIIVQVTGRVRASGMVTLTAGTPVSMALQFAEQPSAEPSGQSNTFTAQRPSGRGDDYVTRLGQRYFGFSRDGDRSLRRISIWHADGTSGTADLVLYRATGDGKYDPFLREGDIVRVPALDQNAPRIAIFGPVRNPGSVEFVEGDRLSDLLRIGLGVEGATRVTSAMLRRADGSETPLTPEEIASMQPRTDVPLLPGDQVFVFSTQPRASTGSVAVDGDVQRPGVYPVTPGRTTLLDVLGMAGGFLPTAMPSQSELYRRRIGTDGQPRDKNREMVLNFQMSNLDIEDTLHWRIGSIADEGRVAVLFHRLFALKDSSADVALEDGDILLVPRNTGTVYVYGQINNPGYIPWEKGRDLDWYIERAGGFGESATTGRARIIKGNTRAWMADGDTDIEPGDMIYVPHEPLVHIASTTDILAVTAAIVGGLAGVTSLIITLMNQ